MRQLRVLVEGLPPSGALARRLAGHHWQHADFLTAELVDRIGQLVTDFRNTNRAEKAPPQPYPEPVWRPGRQAAKKARAKKDRKERASARAGYQRLVAQLTPPYAEKG
ncbi:hypothetical protein [Streptomyces sp. SCSIO ZS0520]|uniref:hypothetical protein n=1 Tax=Streptomyces sp. SCSIO ZS0520 TaxID=2892996 RepID=UPI0021D91E14|nr:hypothetical protein [Streptomyces sp. SCSIO ZS0520]